VATGARRNRSPFPLGGSLFAPAIARGIAIGVATGIAAAVAMAAPAQSATTTDPGKVGMYGVQDPTYDGTFRQSLAILALGAVGGAVDPAATEWLLDQQCPDGGFMGFALDATCTPDPVLFTAEDSNLTALAAMALQSVGQTDAASDAAGYLATVLDGSGGFEYQPGFGADPNSSGLGVSALISLGLDPTSFGSQDTTAGLIAQQADCSADPLDIGGFIAPYSGQADLLATVQALPAAAGSGYPVPAPASFADTVPDIACPGAFAEPELAAADWLENQPLANFSSVDQRAFAVMSFAAAAAGKTKATEIYTAMLADLPGAITDSAGQVRPGAAALYLLAGVALGVSDPDAGANLTEKLQATLNTAASAQPTASPTTPAASPVAAATGAPADPAELADSGLPGAVVEQIWVAMALLVIGVGLVLVTRRRSPRQ
jgi:hypothetical protein